MENVSKKKLNVIDVLILLVIVTCVVGLVVRFGNFGFSSSSEDLDDYEISFLVSNIAYDSQYYFSQGDTVTLVDKGVVLGKLDGLVKPTPAVFSAQEKNGMPITVSYPTESSRIDVKGTIASKGVMGENGYLLGGTTYIAPGAEYKVQSEHMDFVLTITDIVKK